MESAALLFQTVLFVELNDGRQFNLCLLFLVVLVVSLGHSLESAGSDVIIQLKCIQ